MLIETLGQMNNMEAFKLNNDLSEMSTMPMQYTEWCNIKLLDPSTPCVMSQIK